MTEQSKATSTDPAPVQAGNAKTTDQAKTATGAPLIEQPPGEIGGPRGPEPTRYGDWEAKGRCSDF